MRKVTKFLSVMSLAVLMVLPSTGVFASSKTFTNFKYTTVPYIESWEVVTSRQKPDSEQNWYITLTAQNNLGTRKQQCRGQMMSSDSQKHFYGRVPLAVYSNDINKTSKISYGPLKVVKGKTYKLFFSGDENYSAKTTITLSGRYTS